MEQDNPVSEIVDNFKVGFRHWWNNAKREAQIVFNRVYDWFFCDELSDDTVDRSEMQKAWQPPVLDIDYIWDIEEKQCSQCKQVLPISHFNRHAQTVDGYTKRCVKCLGFNEHGYNKDGYDRYGYDADGYDQEGYDESGYDRYGRDKLGILKTGYVDISDVAKERTKYLYFIYAPEADRVKIGISKTPNKRLQALMRSSPIDLELLGIVPGDENDESKLHSRFAQNLFRDEWFNLEGDLADWLYERFDF